MTSGVPSRYPGKVAFVTVHAEDLWELQSGM